MTAPLRLPAAVRAAYARWEGERVWGQGPEAATWSFRRGGAVRYVKVAVRDRYPDLRSERDRMVWLGPYIAVPEVLDFGGDGALEWLVTAPLPGRDATRSELEPARLVRALAIGLRDVHRVPAEPCPFRFELDVALRHVRDRVERGQVDAERDFHPEHADHSPASALATLESSRPEDEDLVVCHGDYCPPNVFLEGDRVSGYLDLGEVGVADRWWDLAVATWSLDWNLGPGWGPTFMDAYGVEPDPARIRYYRLLYDLAS